MQLIPEHFREDQRKAIEGKLSEDPSYGQTTWTGKSSCNALRWEHDKKESSPSLIIWRFLEELGFEPSGVHGPYFWRLPTGRSLWEEAEAIEASENGEAALAETLAVAAQAAQGIRAEGGPVAGGGAKPAGPSTTCGVPKLDRALWRARFPLVRGRIATSSL